MRASRRLPMSRFQPGIRAMYASTGAAPSAVAMRGLPPERTAATFWPLRGLIDLALRAPGRAFAPAFGGDLAGSLRLPPARDACLVVGFTAASSRDQPLALDVF